MPKRLCKRIRLAQERFQREVKDLLLSLGATAGSVYSFQIETKAGTLHVSPHENWIATRFEDVELARQLFGNSPHGRLNPHSGKWNFHFEETHLADGTALACINAQLRPLLLAEHSTASIDVPIIAATTYGDGRE